MNIYETDAPQHGERATETTHRKIELQSPADLTYLIANVSRAAREKIDKHLPPDAAPEGKEDAMRRKVEVLVDEVCIPRACEKRIWVTDVSCYSTSGIRLTAPGIVSQSTGWIRGRWRGSWGRHRKARVGQRALTIA